MRSQSSVRKSWEFERSPPPAEDQRSIKASTAGWESVTRSLEGSGGHSKGLVLSQVGGGAGEAAGQPSRSTILGPSRIWSRFDRAGRRSEEHTSELQSLMRISYAVFCLKKKKNIQHKTHNI